MHEDALICDLAEYYHIHDWREFPLRYVATLAFGLLGRGSRLEKEISGNKSTLSELLLASCSDRLGILAWQNTEDGHKNRNKPPSILKALTEEPQRAQKDYKTFTSHEAFEAEWERLSKSED